DLRKHGCALVSYLPFAYAPQVHYSEPPHTDETDGDFSADVAFAGGADPDRVSLVAALIRDGFTVALYGGYWDRYPETRQATRGHAGPQTLRKAIGAAQVALRPVRRANSDGDSMRPLAVA